MHQYIFTSDQSGCRTLRFKAKNLSYAWAELSGAYGGMGYNFMRGYYDVRRVATINKQKAYADRAVRRQVRVKRVKLPRPKRRKTHSTTSAWMKDRWGKGRSDKRKPSVWAEPLIIRRGY